MSRSKGNIYEICGVAGSGKSTTFGAFKGDDFKLGFKLSERSSLWDIVCAIVDSIIPILRSGCKGLVFLRWKNIIYLNAMFRILNRQTLGGEQSRVLDQGPVYIQAFLLTDVRGYTPSNYIKSWIAEDIERWSTLFGGLIILKADLATISNRVNSRAQGHFLKSEDMGVAEVFLKKYTKAYHGISTGYSKFGVAVKEIDSSCNGIDEVKTKAREFIKGDK